MLDASFMHPAQVVPDVVLPEVEGVAPVGFEAPVTVLIDIVEVSRLPSTGRRSYRPAKEFCYSGPRVNFSLVDDKENFVDGINRVESLEGLPVTLKGNLIEVDEIEKGKLLTFKLLKGSAKKPEQVFFKMRFV